MSQKEEFEIVLPRSTSSFWDMDVLEKGEQGKAIRPLQGPADDAQIDGEIHPNKHSRGHDPSGE